MVIFGKIMVAIILTSTPIDFTLTKTVVTIVGGWLSNRGIDW